MFPDQEQAGVRIVSEQEVEYAGEIIHPVICEGDVIGGVILLSRDGKKPFTGCRTESGRMRGRFSGTADGTVRLRRLCCEKRNWRGITGPFLSYVVIDKEGRGMERKLRRDTRILWVLKGLLVSYIVTGILLLLLAMALYRLELTEKKRICGSDQHAI